MLVVVTYDSRVLLNHWAMPTVSSHEPTKRVIAYYYNYRCVYINEAVAAIESHIHVCPLNVHMCRATITGSTHTCAAVIARHAFDEHTNATRQIVRVCASAITSALLCAATSGQPVHRHPPVLPATRLRTPRRGAARPRPRHWTTRLARWQASSCQYEKKSAK